MSFIKINDQVISLNDLFVWVCAYIDFYNSGAIKSSEVPSDIENIILANTGKEEKAELIMGHIQENEKFLKTLQDVVKDKTSKKVFDQ